MKFREATCKRRLSHQKRRNSYREILADQKSEIGTTPFFRPRPATITNGTEEKRKANYISTRPPFFEKVLNGGPATLRGFEDDSRARHFLGDPQ